MVTFITSLKKSVTRNPSFLKTFLETIASVQAQTDDRFKIIVVADSEDCPILDIPDIDVIPVNFDAEFDFKKKWLLDASRIATLDDMTVRVDKGCKYIVGTNYARRFDPDYISFLDCDDLVSNQFVELILAVAPKRGWVCRNGYMLDVRKGNLTLLRDFNTRCGTCISLRTGMLDFPAFEGSLEQEEIFRRFGAQYVTRVFGSHRHADQFFELDSLDRPLAIYRVGHGQNVSGTSTCAGHPVPLTPSIREEFSVPLHTI